MIRRRSYVIRLLGIDLWAFGIMLLEHYCPLFMEAYQVDILVEAARAMEDEERILKALDEIRQSFVMLYDQRRYVDHLPSSLPLLRQLLEFCLRRPSNVGLHSANERTVQELSDLIASLPIDEIDEVEDDAETEDELPTTARKTLDPIEGDSTTARKLEVESVEGDFPTATKSAVDPIDVDPARMRKREFEPVEGALEQACPVRLPWGNCEVTKHGDVWSE